jgi:hypothetical protein
MFPTATTRFQEVATRGSPGFYCLLDSSDDRADGQDTPSAEPSSSGRLFLCGERLDKLMAIAYDMVILAVL